MPNGMPSLEQSTACPGLYTRRKLKSMADTDITLLLRQLSGGDESVREELFVRVYAELRRLARIALSSENREHTLQPTALVHEAYLRLLGEAEIEWVDRYHFFSTATRTMRRILRDYARAAKTQKRRAGQRFDLNETIALTEARAESYLALDQALDRLEELDPRQCRIVELKYFVGLTNEDIAAAIGRDVRTVKRDWQMARAWLHGQLTT
jgi:RNA polymerase sigma-70 factor, ECF subfamily